MHVHVNKTLSTTVEQADDLIALAHERGLGLVASPGRRCVRSCDGSVS